MPSQCYLLKIALIMQLLSTEDSTDNAFTILKIAMTSKCYLLSTEDSNSIPMLSTKESINNAITGY